MIDLQVNADLDPCRKCSLKGTMLYQNNNDPTRNNTTMPIFVKSGSVVRKLLF